MTVINSLSQQKHAYTARDTIQTLHTTRETIQTHNKGDNNINSIFFVIDSYISIQYHLDYPIYQD